MSSGEISAINDLKTHMQSANQVGGITKMINIPLTVAANAHSAGDSLGGSIEIQGATRHGGVITRSGVIQSVALIGDDGDTLGGVTVHFFNGNPSATDDAAFDPSDAIVMTKMPGSAVMTTTDNLEEFDERDILEKSNLGIPFQLTGENHLYAVIICDEAVTPGATDSTWLNVGILLD